MFTKTAQWMIVVVFGWPAIAAGQALALPDLQTEDGALAHLLLSESLTPFNSAYDAADVARGMKAIRALVDNRIHHIPAGYKAKDLDAEGANTARLAIGLGKFQGFSLSDGKLVITKGIKMRIDDILKQANTGKPGKFYKHVQTALDIAKQPADDPFQALTMVGKTAVTGRVYGMYRAADNQDLGGNFVYIGNENGGLLGGNKFYTLKKLK